MNYGVTKEGFVKKPFSELLANLENKLRSKLGPDTYLAPETELGQISAIFVDQVADLWDLQEAVYNSRFPSTAFGKSLDNAFEFTFDRRKSGEPCRVSRATAVSETPRTITAGDLFLLGPDKHKFMAVTTVSLEESGTVYQNELSLISDENKHFLISEGSGLISEDKSVTVAVLKFENGQDRETDSQAKIRRLKDQAVGAHSTFPAIKNRLMSTITGVISVDIIVNHTQEEGADGQPPGTVQILTEGGQPSDIAMVLHRDCIPPGTPLWGKIKETVTADDGEQFVCQFSQVEDVAVYVLAEISTGDEFRYPDNAGDLTTYFRTLISDQGNLLKRGQDVNSDPWLAGSFRNIVGIEDLEIGLGKDMFPENTLNQNIPVEPWEKALFRPENIRIVVLNNEPVSDTVSVSVKCRLTFSRESASDISAEYIQERIARQIRLSRRGSILSSALISRAISHPGFISAVFSVSAGGSFHPYYRLLEDQKAMIQPGQIEAETEFV